MTHKKIDKIAVLGTGIMGSQIAAHCANGRFETLLFGLSNDQQAPDSAFYAIDQLSKMQPAPLAHPQFRHYLKPMSYDDCDALVSCDLVIEAVTENKEVKRDLYQRITPHIDANCLIGSNTSGLSIEDLSSFLPSRLRKNFCGIHFFNPPRYLPLVELTPATQTSANCLDTIEDWLMVHLGKHIVVAKDTPGFIANRFGVFALLSALHHGEQFGFAPDLIDELTGKLIHRSKSATFKTLDLVGLDLTGELVQNLHRDLVDDPWRDYFVLPKWLTDMIARGHLGRKTHLGVYRKDGDAIHVFDPVDKSYRPRRSVLDKSVKEVMGFDEEARLEALLSNEHPQAQFLCAVYFDMFCYAAYHAEQLAHSLRDIDLAMRWGYGWEHGIFEQWQQLGWRSVNNQLQNSTRYRGVDVPLPEWIANCDGVYGQDNEHGQVYKAAPCKQSAVHHRHLYTPILYGEHRSLGQTVSDSDCARVWHEEEILIFSLKTKMHTLSYQTIVELDQALTLAEEDYKGLIIWSDETPFCAGANLLEMLLVAKIGKIDETNISSWIKGATLKLSKPELPDISELPPANELIHYLQQTFMRLRNCRVPTVAAVQGLALGGGCEMLLHCDRTVAALESYIGLVEIGVGLLPAGGGCKEMAARAYADAKGADPFPYVSRYYEHIAKAKVSSSAVEAKAMGYLRDNDVIIMNPYQLMHVAKQQIHALDSATYRPPHPIQRFKVAGVAASANLRSYLLNLYQGNYISDYDYQIASVISDVLCGSPLAQGQEVNAQWYFEQECKAFIDLLKSKKTQERIEHMLTKGKPLRN